jgi:hypothetical protein
MMVNKKAHKKNSIPVHFVDDETGSATEERDESALEAHSNEDTLTPEEIGRASAYEDETEMQRRIDRGQEGDSEGGRERADDKDTAGGPPHDELPERREDQNREASNAEASAQPVGEASAPRPAIDTTATGPVLAELIATRAELRRVETERTELREALSRRQADFENYRKRV